MDSCVHVCLFVRAVCVLAHSCLACLTYRVVHEAIAGVGCAPGPGAMQRQSVWGLDPGANLEQQVQARCIPAPAHLEGRSLVNACSRRNKQIQV